MTALAYDCRAPVWQRTRKILVRHFAEAVDRAKYHFCGRKGIRGRGGILSHPEFTALQSEAGHSARQGI